MNPSPIEQTMCPLDPTESRQFTLQKRWGNQLLNLIPKASFSFTFMYENALKVKNNPAAAILKLCTVIFLLESFVGHTNLMRLSI